jgi:hypothetical protein
MTKPKILLMTAVAASFVLCAITAFSQTAPQLLKRTTYKNDRFEFGVGGTVAIVGAPQGSIKVEGWSKNEIEINATIELQAPTESDLSKLAEVTGFATEESLGRTGIISLGVHDKKTLKKAKLPKNLFGLPFRIDYDIKVPRFCDLQIDSGSGDLTESASVLWKIGRGTPYVPSPLLLGDRLYFTKGREALLSVIDTKTGRPILDEVRLPGANSFYASPVAAAGRVYLVDRGGTTVVLKQSDKLEILATNRLDDPMDASPVVVGRQLFLRGETNLYCIEE